MFLFFYKIYKNIQLHFTSRFQKSQQVVLEEAVILNVCAFSLRLQLKPLHQSNMRRTQHGVTVHEVLDIGGGARRDQRGAVSGSSGGPMRQHTAMPAVSSVPVALRTRQRLPVATVPRTEESWEAALQSVRVQPEGQDTSTWKWRALKAGGQSLRASYGRARCRFHLLSSSSALHREALQSWSVTAQAA